MKISTAAAIVTVTLGGFAITSERANAQGGVCGPFCDMCWEEFDEYWRWWHHFWPGLEGTCYSCWTGEGCHLEEIIGSCLAQHEPFQPECNADADVLARAQTLVLLAMFGDTDGVSEIAEAAALRIRGQTATRLVFSSCTGAAGVVVTLPTVTLRQPEVKVAEPETILSTGATNEEADRRRSSFSGRVDMR
jgi:hypothetical protein